MSVLLVRAFEQGLYLEEALVNRPMTMAAWVKSDDDAIDQVAMCVCRSDAAHDLHEVWLNSGSYDRLEVRSRDYYNSGSVWIGSVEEDGWEKDVWYFVVGQVDGTQWRKIYINRDNEQADSLDHISVATGDRTCIGWQAWVSSDKKYFSGRISEVSMWNCILTPAEIDGVYNGTPPTEIQADHLKAYWPLYDDALDVSGNNKHLILWNNPSFDINDHGSAELPELNATVTAQSSSVGDLTVDFQTPKAAILHWKPQDNIQEILESKTTILTANDGTEQRIKSRQIPRQLFKMQFILDTDKKNAWFDSVLHAWQKSVWAIPVWTEQVLHSAAITTDDTVITVDTTYADFRDDSWALIWKSETEYEAVPIQIKTDSQLTLKFGVVNNFTGAKYIIPLRLAHMISKNQKRKYNSGASVITTIFAVDNNIAITGHSPAVVYDDLEVLTIPAYMDNFHNEMSDAQITISDYETGIIKVRSDTEFNLLAQNHLFFQDTKQSCWEFRQFLHWLDGRQKAVLIPTFRNELIQTDNIADVHTYVNVEYSDLTDNMGFNSLRLYIGFKFTDGTLLVRKITGVTKVDIDREKISFNTALGLSVEPEDCKIFFVDKCRLNSDRVELNWVLAHRNECRTSFTRVP